MTYPAVIFILILLASLFGPPGRLVYLWGATIAFGALAILPPESISGFNLLPGAAVALILIARAFLNQRRAYELTQLAFELDAMILLTMFMFIAILSAILYPRMFQGQVQVVPMRGDNYDLAPTMANFTQLSYVLVSCLMVIVTRHMAERPGFVEYFIRGLLVGGSLLLLTGLISLVLGPQASLISAAFKTAKYAYLSGSEVAGFRRVDGFMTEASAFGGSCIGCGGILLFLGGTLKSASERLFAKALAWLLLGMAVLSTSSAAYLGLAVLLAVYSAWSIVRVIQGRTRLTMAVGVELIAVLIAILVGLGAVILSPELLDQPRAMLDVILFKKVYSSSYYERSMWNKIAMEALWQTWGVGVGVGAARASNWVVAVLSNTGVLGGLALFGFILRLILARPNRSDRADVVTGLKLVILVDMVPRIMVATTPDFGVSGALEFGILAAFTATASVLEESAPQTNSSGRGAAAPAVHGARP